MKKELLIHFSSLAIFFVLVAFFRNWFSVAFLPFWIGGVIGTLLPDIDHLIYIYYLRPQEYVSERVSYMFAQKQIKNAFVFLAETRSERKKLIFHTVIFQAIFLVLTFFVLTSSGSVLGRGLVLAFALHLSVDQLIDIRKTGRLDNWLKQVPILGVQNLGKRELMVYWGIGLSIVLFFGFLF